MPRHPARAAARGGTTPPAQAAPGSLGGQFARFLAVGAASTLAYVLLYLGLRTALAAQPANAISLLVTALLNIAVNRRVTFGVRGRPDLARHQAQGLLAFGAGLALTAAALAALHAAVPHPARAAEVAVLIAASLVATALRFALYRSGGFRRRPGPGPATRTPSGESTALATVSRRTTEPNGHRP